MEDLALKYRPRRFDQVVGNIKTVIDLKGRSKSKNFSKVTLFIGTTGTGKSSLQLILAKIMLCENPQEGEQYNEQNHEFNAEA